MINHFTGILDDYEERLQQNYDQLPRRPDYQRMIFINRRIEDYRKIVDDYNQFIENSGLDINDFNDINEFGVRADLHLIPYSLWNIGNQQLTQLEGLLLRILQKERNLYLYYKLIVLARRLILSFIQDNYANAYIARFNDLESQVDENNNSYRLQLSIFEYVATFDYYELTSNNLHDMLRNQAFGTLRGTNNLFRDLRSDELELAAHGRYPVRCQCDTNVFSEYVPMINTYRIYNTSSGITAEEFGAFEDFRIHGEDRPNNTYNLYRLYYSEYVVERPYLQVKLQLHYITQQVIAQMHPQALVYNHELIETVDLREGVAIQPQIREIYIQYPPPARRRPRNGGRGGNGSGGNGQHGGGRRRRGGNGDGGN